MKNSTRKSSGFLTIIKFKVHIRKSLEDYEGFVVDQVELELSPSNIVPTTTFAASRSENAYGNGGAAEEGFPQTTMMVKQHGLMSWVKRWRVLLSIKYARGEPIEKVQKLVIKTTE